MTNVLIAILFILQLISFYLIILLNAKLAKYKDLEAKQMQVIEEMDNSIGAYLMEMKEENDRLIKELSNVKVNVPKNDVSASINISEKPIQVNMKAIPKTVVANVYEKNIEAQSILSDVPPSQILKQVEQLEEKLQKAEMEAMEQKLDLEEKQAKEQEQVSTLTPFEKEVLQMFEAGESVEEIAKKTQKGKTEIELLIKFHS